MCCPRKEFATPRDAIRALHESKIKVTEMMHQARQQHVSQFKTAVGKVIKDDHMVSTMPRIRISAARSLTQGHSNLANTAVRNMFPSSTKNTVQGGLTSSNIA